MTKVFFKIICEKRDFLFPLAYNNYKSLLLAREHESKGEGCRPTLRVVLTGLAIRSIRNVISESHLCTL